MKRIYQVFAALCILAAVSAVNFKVTRDRFYDDYSYFHKPRSDDESYDPFSDEFRFHSLYEDLPETNYSSLANELAVFLPKSEQEYFKIPIYVDKVIESLMEPHTRRNRYLELVSKANVFKKLGVYEELRNQTKLIPYKVVKNKNYCDEVDVLNLIYPSNLYHHHGVLDTYWRKTVRDMLSGVSNMEYVSKKGGMLRRIIKPYINVMFGTDGNYDIIRAVGMDYNCITQGYSTVIGTLDISTKHIMVKYFE